ncbi:MAG TPA: hypothetical protein VMU51_12005 [Mycobacteriales bacterium]|nr:hypothetical protein [Mycobacteriales bacterium]
MSTALEDELRAAMRSHTADMLPPPDLVDAARRGGVHRRFRARLAVGGAPLLVVAVALGGLTLRAPSGPGTTQVAAMTVADEALLVRPTAGDLAGNAGYLSAVTRAWERSHRGSIHADRGIFDLMLGRPHVVWAGQTPVGPAAIVVQATYLRHHDNIQLDREGPALLTGFVGAGSRDEPTVVADTYPAPGAPQMEAAFIGAGRQVLLVLDRGRPVQVSFDRTYTDDGYVTRRWAPVPFAAGVALLTRPDRTDPRLTALRPRGPGSIWIGNVMTPAEEHAAAVSPIERRLQWLAPGGGPGTWQVGQAPAAGWGGGPVATETVATQFEQVMGRRIPSGYPEISRIAFGFWYVWGTTPDGSRLMVGERQLDADPCHVFAVLRSPAGRVEVASRPTDTGGPLPVAVPLPRGQGWVVAQVGAELSYRTGDGGWQAAGRDAALLPAGAVAVRVVRAGHTDEVPLRR